MFKKILVPVDFSPASKIAVDCARKLLNGKGQLTLIHVFPSKIRETLTFYDIPGKVRELEVRVEELRSKAQQELAKIAQSVEERGIQPKIIFKEGDPASAVIQESMHGYDLVVVGIPEKKAQIASTALNIIKGIRICCLVVKEAKSRLSFERVLFTADFSDVSKSAYSELITKMLKVYKSDVTVFNVFELHPLPYLEQGMTWMVGDIEEIKKNLQGRLVAEYPMKGVTYIVVEGADAGIEIVDFAERNKYNIIVVAHEEREWVERAFLGSVTTKVVKLSKLPVLIYRKSKTV